MIKIAEKEMFSELVSETSYSSTPLGKHKSTLTLYGSEEDITNFFIEWDIPNLETVEIIGIWCEDGSKKIIDYDGVFELFPEVITFLKENGFDTEDVE